MVQLRGLIALGQIRVKVIFTVEHRAPANLGIHRQAKHDCVPKRLLVGHGQGAGHGQINGVGLGVGFGAIGGAGTGKNLGSGGELNVNFQPDHNVPLHSFSLLFWAFLGLIAVHAGASRSPAGIDGRH
jgi:hypothetical protein